uniref:Uncharacterized protein n=1 Tax=Avena sativa TaxID=4498 RepID=A0ACD6AF91_AVESA
MPSWHDGSSSSGSILEEFTALDHAPATTDDPTFYGIANDFPELCHGHKLPLRKCVAFEGINAGRKFYLCQVGHVNNCGFHSWIDPEWPATMKNALARLWEMYNESNSARIEERYESSKMLKDLAEEKEKAVKKHACLIAETNKFFEETGKKAMEENRRRIYSEAEQEEQMEKYIAGLKNEVEVYKQGNEEFKNLLKTQATIYKEKQKKWEDEKQALKEEKKKLEYSLFDLFNATDSNKEKIKRIKAICDE